MQRKIYRKIYWELKKLESSKQKDLLRREYINNNNNDDDDSNNNSNNNNNNNNNTKAFISLLVTEKIDVKDNKVQ